MQVLENELVVCFDVDGTLITPADDGPIKLPYAGKISSFSALQAHVDLLKSYNERGFTVIVWSMGGHSHAKKVVEALKLERFVDIVMSKPNKYVDDKEDLPSILGTRVFIA